ncbi:MAG: hypothetical protein QF415_11505 [Candidatus Undinarchaeales archaeon]|nr:hypothetical protein [Candidatus Undinarchaeales archaeon]MDP7494558.1 hypothetical protein [Candidatus Undinarchaeales archaeon]
MRLLSRIVAVLFVSLLLSPAVGLEAESAIETVDVSNLQLASISIAYKLPPYYVATLSESAIAGRCSVLSSVSSCSPSIMVDSGTVSFSMIESIDLKVESFEVGDERVRVDLFVSYEPKQFSLMSGIWVKRRELKIKYPTHMTIVTDVLARPFGASFSLSGTPEHTTLEMENTTFEVGQALPIPHMEGKLCVAALAQDERALLMDSSVGCETFSLGTDAFVAEGDYDLYVMAVRKAGVAVARIPVKLTRPQLLIQAKPSVTSVNLGDEVMIEVSSEPALEGCVVSILDMNGIRVDTMTLRKCTSIPLGTQTAWTPGKYLVRIEGFVGSVKGQASFSIDLRGRGYAPAETKTDKESYVAGDTIGVYTEAQGDYCDLELFDEENTKVGESDAPGCGYAEIESDESLTNGSYIVRTKVYSGGDLTAVSSRGIEIHEWRPPVRSPRAELCRGGYMYIDTFKLPCVTEGDVCIPSSTSVPSCLCFNDPGDLVDACEFGYRCSKDGCTERAVESAYIVVREGGLCLAKRGLETVSCVELGEICTGTCVCLDKESRPVSSCSLGQTCTHSGCQDLRLEMGIEDKDYTKSIRVNELEAGFDLVATGRISYRTGQVENQLVTADRADITIEASLGNLDAESIDMIYVSPEEGWQVTSRFTGSLNPGEHELFLIVGYRGDVHVIRKPFEVWHPEDMKDMGVKLTEVTPASMSIGTLQKGGTVELTAKIVNANEEELPHLPPEAFSVTTGQLIAYSVATTYDRTSELWTIIANFRNATVQRSDSITLGVSSLGREGRTSEQFEVVDQVPLAIRIARTTPGTKDKPLFYLFATMGFDMDIFTSIEGAMSVRKENLSVKIGKHDVSDDIAYLVSTAEGIRIHLSEVKLCPDPPMPNSDLMVSVGVEVGGKTAEDTTTIRLHGNPGNWRNMKGGSC